MSNQDNDATSISRAKSLCMLNTSIFTVAGVLVGLGLGIKQKSLNPLVLSGFIGAAGDLAYGYFYACRDITQDYETAIKWNNKN
eukprot:gene995-1952_t